MPQCHMCEGFCADYKVSDEGPLCVVCLGGLYEELRKDREQKLGSSLYSLVYGFIRDVERSSARRDGSRPGGQQVNEHLPFCNVPPGAARELEWYAKAFRLAMKADAETAYHRE